MLYTLEVNIGKISQLAGDFSVQVCTMAPRPPLEAQTIQSHGSFMCQGRTKEQRWCVGKEYFSDPVTVTQTKVLHIRFQIYFLQ